jgi:hypothetical protein
MKMGFIFSQVFWGIFLILLGISFILKVLFHLDIPVFRLFVSFLLIYMGLRVLTGGFSCERNSRNLIFNDYQFKVNTDGEYNVIFGRGIVDLSEYQVNANTYIKINVIFGSGLIKLDPAQPLKIRVNSAFAGAKMPDGNMISFGEYNYQTPAVKEDQPYGKMEVNVVFGEMQLTEKR